jgi:hypothetical protein
VHVFVGFRHVRSQSVLHGAQIGTSDCATRPQRGGLLDSLCLANIADRTGRCAKSCTSL